MQHFLRPKIAARTSLFLHFVDFQLIVRGCLAVWLSSVGCSVTCAEEIISLESGAKSVSFRGSVAAVLLAKCHGCHNGQNSEGGYDVSTFASLWKRGDSDDQPIVPGDPQASELYRRLITDDEGLRMPFDAEPLADDSVQLVQRWIEQGAVYDADDRDAPLSSILPVARHPNPPGRYTYPIPVTAVAFVDGDLLVSGYHEVLRWNTEEESIQRRYSQIGERTSSILPLRLDGRGEANAVIAVVGGSPGRLGEVRLLDAESGELIAVPLATTDVILGMALRPDQTELAVGGADSQIHRIDLQTMRSTQTIRSHSDWVRGVAWNHDGSRLASASRDKTAKVFDAATGRPIATYTGHGEDVFDVCFTEDRRLLSCDAAGKVHVWRAKEDKRLEQLESKIKRAFAIKPSVEGQAWLAADRAVLRLRRQEKLCVVETLSCDADVLSIAISPDRSKLASGDARGRVRIWNGETGELEREFVAFPMK